MTVCRTVPSFSNCFLSRLPPTRWWSFGVMSAARSRVARGNLAGGYPTASSVRASAVDGAADQSAPSTAAHYHVTKLRRGSLVKLPYQWYLVLFIRNILEGLFNTMFLFFGYVYTCGVFISHKKPWKVWILRKAHSLPRAPDYLVSQHRWCMTFKTLRWCFFFSKLACINIHHRYLFDNQAIQTSTW